ncbi:hypothetical protein D0T25_26225 [Duganella sp. BJB488]|uniref:hypothetical protein n=1 Tax=unclassified Duganella TaxID=2636909 RepID=UPI000E34D010|nr:MULTISPECIES: hypothetical protein [unclassified Duganella]NVD72789.1 hypothetical protein [Duganella sp. BJB1802]RFP11634.1 hypothetical protein D0T26_25055 [Duganella sp. BJB489]RFP15652.1 hypothetical protein D0T25_26225 [Duganella sp. BJB488]RFP30599.1 hypothetical protein D0T24_26925 [Duganella sp. BJB480]
MKRNSPLLLLLLSLSLAGCTLTQPRPPLPTPAEVTLPPPPAIVELPPPPPPDEVGPLLSYHQQLRKMTQGDMLKELSGLSLQQRSPRVAVQMGMVLMLTRGSGDLARAQALLDSVATATETEAQPFKALAQLLSSNCAETRRLAEHADKLAVQQKDSQRRIDQLNEMLEGLKTIERTLPARPAPGPQAVIK